MLLGALLALSGCADGKYPSLAQRPVERGSAPAISGPSPSPTTAEPASPALLAQLASLLGSAREAHAAFLARRGEAERLVAAAQGAPVPSDAWAAANEAVAELDTNRTGVAMAQNQLERLYIDDRLAHALDDGVADGPARPVAAALSAARDEVLAMAAKQDAVLDELKARLPG